MALEITDVINELTLFSDKVLALNPPVAIQVIEAFEKQFNVKLPGDYIAFVQRFNGMNLMGTEVYGIGEEAGVSSLDRKYIIEHQEVGNPMYNYLVPFSHDGYGSHYCFDTSALTKTSCNIVFWQHDHHYSPNDPPEVTNASFAEWVKEVAIDWTLDEYDYDGNSR